MNRNIVLIIFALLITTATAAEEYVGRVSIDTLTGHVIEYQSGGTAPLGTLRQNAINVGYNPANVDEKYITEYEYSIWRMYGIYPPNQTIINTLEQTRLQQQANNTQNQTIAGRIKQNYSQAMTDLNTIQNANPPFTSAGFNQVIWAQKREAAILQDILRFLKWVFFKSE